MVTKTHTVLKTEYLGKIDTEVLTQLASKTPKPYRTLERWKYAKKVAEFAHPTYLKVLAEIFGVEPAELTEEKELA